MVISSGKTSLITELLEAVPRHVTLLVGIYVMEQADSYGVLMEHKVIMHAALMAVSKACYPRCACQPAQFHILEGPCEAKIVEAG